MDLKGKRQSTHVDYYTRPQKDDRDGYAKAEPTDNTSTPGVMSIKAGATRMDEALTTDRKKSKWLRRSRLRGEN